MEIGIIFAEFRPSFVFIFRKFILRDIGFGGRFFGLNRNFFPEIGGFIFQLFNGFIFTGRDYTLPVSAAPELP